MNKLYYPTGFVGRLDLDVMGVTNLGTEMMILQGSLVQVMGVEDHGRQDAGDDGIRHDIVLLIGCGAPHPAWISYSGLWHGSLMIEPGVITWETADSVAASGQCWDIFSRTLNDDLSMWELQRIDGDTRFETDDDAAVFVWVRAVTSECPVAKKALEFLMARSPSEYARIRKLGIQAVPMLQV